MTEHLREAVAAELRDAAAKAMAEAGELETLRRMALLSTAQVAQLYNISPRTLAEWRSEGIGPRYMVLGGKMVRYRHEDLADFFDANIKLTRAQGA